MPHRSPRPAPRRSRRPSVPRRPMTAGARSCRHSGPRRRPGKPSASPWISRHPVCCASDHRGTRGDGARDAPQEEAGVDRRRVHRRSRRARGSGEAGEEGGARHEAPSAVRTSTVALDSTARRRWRWRRRRSTGVMRRRFSRPGFTEHGDALSQARPRRRRLTVKVRRPRVRPARASARRSAARCAR